MGRWVLVGEIGLTVILVVASGLLVQSLSRLLEVPLGFDPENVVKSGFPFVANPSLMKTPSAFVWERFEWKVMRLNGMKRWRG